MDTKRIWWYNSGVPFTPDDETFDTTTFASYSTGVAVEFRDTFNGTAGTLLTAKVPETGGTWTVHPSYASGVALLDGNGNVYSNGASADSIFFNTTILTASSYEVSYKLKIKTNISSPEVSAGVALDLSNVSPAGYSLLFSPSGGTWNLGKISVGNLTVSAGSNSASYSNGTDLDVRIRLDRRVSGKVTFTLWVNGVYKCKWVDTSPVTATGRIGLRLIRASSATTGYIIDGLSAKTLAGTSLIPSKIRLDPSSTSNEVVLKGFRTAWDALKPTFLISGGTITNTVYDDFSKVTLTINADAGNGFVTISDPSNEGNVKILRCNNARPSSLSGYAERKRMVIVDGGDGIKVRTDYTLNLRINKGTGTDSSTEVFIGNNVKADWSDIKFTDKSGVTTIPFAVVRRETNYIDVVVDIPVMNTGETSYYLYWNNPTVDVFKILGITDQHYGTDTYDNRDDALTFIQNAVNYSATYQPDLAVNQGDKTAANVTTEATQLSWYQSVLDEFANMTATVKRDGVAPGNHDFEYMSFANVLAKHSGETWMESGVMYGAWESDDYHFISLDSNYSTGTNTHLSLAHVGYGYINPLQITWLESELAAASKPVIVFCHHPLCEIDTQHFLLDKEIYHVQNREAVRKVLEDSGKVVCVIHGHLHFDRVDNINGIPYIIQGNLTATGLVGELPANPQGNWSTFDFDNINQIITYKRIARVSGVDETIYIKYIPFGNTSSVGSFNNDKAIRYNYMANYEKSSYVQDATSIYVNDDDFVRLFPANIQAGEPYLSDRTIKINGRTSSPSFGRAYAYFAAQDSVFNLDFHFRSATLSTKYFKVGNHEVITTAGPYLVFHTDGNIKAFNGASLTTLTTYSTNTWYKVRMVINVTSDVYSVYVDDVLLANNYTFNTTLFYCSLIEIVTETGDAYINGLRLTRNVTEPTITYP